MASQIYFSLDKIQAEKGAGKGSLTRVTSKEVPGFVNISFESLKLGQNDFQEPLWHPNAHKIGYCLQGKAFISMRTAAGLEIFTVEEGDIFFIPKGAAHSIANRDEEENLIAFALNHPLPEVMRFSKALNSLSDEVFTATFKTPPNYIKDLKKGKSTGLIQQLPPANESRGNISSRFKFNIENSPKVIKTPGGFLQNGTKAHLPVLDGLGILGFGLNPKGFVEPHWHTNAGELIYIVTGKTRITVLSPDGKVEELEVNGGQGAFAAASHFHNIENIGNEEVKVIAFFSDAEPDYIGFGEVFGSFSNEMLASIFNVSPNYFQNLKKPSGPLVIVPT